ncbi:3-dehydroquinate synthase II [Gracilibacillus sp. YIM 98692]|uniref:3-dehydroquinate synthase II n=1 Tax=Gracilibacillus sp. YIM 98692 TaxID=2663532 RepID=UPI0013D6302F|nr:3-dehydroquinate synthase II [Gracilibacillus sp. YIM 98692]
MEEKWQQAEVVSADLIGEGSRICLDFVDRLAPTEGILLGNTGHGYFFVLAENRITDTYPARPFRINCGAIHHYLLKDEDKTAYLAEIKPGDRVTIYSITGETRQLAVGRVKMEKRPLIRIVTKVGDKEISATLQEADSVHVVTEGGEEKQALSLEKGDRILVFTDDPGRHLGDKIEEDITEI